MSPGLEHRELVILSVLGLAICINSSVYTTLPQGHALCLAGHSILLFFIREQGLQDKQPQVLRDKEAFWECFRPD